MCGIISHIDFPCQAPSRPIGWAALARCAPSKPVISRSAIVLESVLQLLRPAVRLMLRHGVTAPAFATALKRVFLHAAQDELRAHGKALTDSAVSLLSGVHRRDVRNLTRLAPPQQPRAVDLDQAVGQRPGGGGGRHRGGLAGGPPGVVQEQQRILTQVWKANVKAMLQAALDFAEAPRTRHGG